MKRLILLSCLTAIGISSASAQKGNYHIAKELHVLGNGGWDYLAINPLNDNLYVAHSTQVNIINKTTGDSTGVIPNTGGVHGIAFAPEFRKGYTSNGRLNTVTVFDINTNAIIAQVKTGENPDAIMYDPFSKKIFVCNGHSNDLTIIDPVNDKVIKTLPLAGKPETAVSNEEGNIFVNIEDKNLIVVVNAKIMAVDKQWKIGKGQEPTGLAIDKKTHRLFAGCGNGLLVVVNADNGHVVKQLPIGEGCDGVAFDAGSKQIFTSNGEGTLTIIKENDPGSYSVMATVKTAKGARTLALDPITHSLYLPTADFTFDPAGPQKSKRAFVPGSFRILVVNNQ